MDPVYYNDEQYQELTQNLDQLITQAEELPDKQTRELIFVLLRYFDLLHREALSRLMDLLTNEFPNIQARLKDDFAIKTLLSLYDLMENEAPEKNLPKQGFVPVEEVGLMTDITKPVWIPAGNKKDLEPDKIYAKNFDGKSVLICKIEDEIYATQNSCVDSILPLEFGELDGYEVICPWHGCRYDLRTGEMAGWPEKKLMTFPVEVDSNGKFSVGFNII